MNPETLEVHGYKKIDDSVRRVEAWLATGSRAMLGYSAPACDRRIAQKLVADLTVPFLQQGTRQYLRGKEHFPSDDGQFECGGLKVDTKTGRAAPSASLLIRSTANFVLLWTAVFGAWLLGLVAGRRRPPCVLLSGIPEADLSFQGNDQRFADFCRGGTLTVLTRARWLVVQAVHKVTATRPTEIRYARYPLLTAFSSFRHGVSRSRVFLQRHLSALIAYIHGVWRRPLNCLLWRDLAEHAAAATLNESGSIDAVVITNSNWLQQMLWMTDLQDRRFRTYMALYSLNSSTMVHRDDPVSYSHPGIRRLRVDEIWVWNDAYQKVLARDGVDAECRTVGPILWYLPDSQRASGMRTEPTLCVFDVNPRPPGYSPAGSDTRFCYYNDENAARFIDDILYARDQAAARLGVGISILLKHKRPPRRMAGTRYFEHLDRILSARAGVKVAPSDSNVYTLIANSMLVIVPPYSSPAYVAGFMKIPAIYYDSSGKILPTFAEDPLISFVGDRERLCAAVLHAAEQALSRHALPV